MRVLRKSVPLVAFSFLALSACENGAIGTSAGATTAAQEAGTNPGPEVLPLGVLWEWAGTVTPVERLEVSQPDHYSLLLQPDGTALMQFDCNRGHGSYEISGNEITFGPMISTRMACPPDSQDFLYMSQLEKVSSYFVQDGNLYLEMPYDSGTMQFRPSAKPD